jgi:nitrogen-specific signal transduction histidine kinase
LRFTKTTSGMMACCPKASAQVVLANMAQRLQAYQVEALHREKLVSLGTLAAGLMHELHNPGSAAKRAPRNCAGNLHAPAGAEPALQRQTQNPLSWSACTSLLEHAIRGCHAPA